jgi:hypothetical protein
VAEDVQLVVNTFERSYREVLAPGFFRRIEEDNRRPFARRVALVNNVDDRADAAGHAEQLVAAGEIDEFHFVADRLDGALAQVGLSERDLGDVPHYSDCSFVAVTLPGPPWVLYWDAEVRLERPTDWITPTIEVMNQDRRVLVGNPVWPAPTLERETLEDRGDFALGRGFSDQLYLVRREDMARPIYSERCLARLRYPMAHQGFIFEARVDSHMRHGQRLRATYRRARYTHPPPPDGPAYPAGSARQRLALVRNAIALRALRASPIKPACCADL